MGKNLKRRAIDKIKFSIGTKLIMIITIIIIVSLGSITALVSWLVREDLQIMAEENNFETNRKAAMEAETLLVNVRAHTRVLINNITGENDSKATQTANYFFTEYPYIGAVFFIAPNSSHPAGALEKVFTNEQFFSTRNIDLSLAKDYFNSQRTALGRAVRGEVIVLNATPVFGRAVMSIFFPLQGGGAAAALFSGEDINNNFGFGLNLSYMINSDGDVLAHSNFDVVRDGVNLLNDKTIKTILSNTSKNSQFLAPTGTKPDTSIFAKLLSYIPNYEVPLRPVREFTAFTKLDIVNAVVITAIEYDKVFEGINATTRRNLYLTAAVLALSIIFIWLFSKSISAPLRGLATAAREIEGGKFVLNIENRKAKDEIGVLNGSFQKMCTALNIFGRFTNKEIAVKAMRNEIKPGGLPKHATIFFSDIRNFTAMSEAFTNAFGTGASDKIVAWLNAYFTQMIDCVEKTNGIIDKFIGDAVMAHWGTATTDGSPKHDAFNCVKAALMMRKALYFLNKERGENDPCNPIIKIGCGINTGIVTAGQLGSEQRMEYTVIGDPVNLASRIEALTKPLGADILISEDTWRLIGDKFITEEMPSVTVKGKERPVRIFAVVNFRGMDKGPKTLSDVRKLLGIKPPEANVDINKEEKKYKIGTDK